MTNGASCHNESFTAGAAGEILLTRNTLSGNDPASFPVIVLQGDAAFTVKVRLSEDADWSAYPGDGSSAAGEVLVIRGRWSHIKVEIADTKKLWFYGDQIFQAWS